MPQSAHNFYEKELKPTLIDVFGEIYDFVTDGDEWYQIGCNSEGTPEDCEWEDRDGFWSHNNGGLGMTFAPNTSILYNGSTLAPCIKEWVESEYADCKESALDNDDYQEWKAQREVTGEDSDVVTWFGETTEGGDFENFHENNWMESTPFCKVEAWLQGEDGYQFHGPVTPDTELKLHFEFCFNDDLGYGRSHISWCPGVGDHPKYECDIFFKAKDVDKVLDVLKTTVLEKSKVSDDKQLDKETIRV